MASSTISAAFFGSTPYSSWSAVTLPAPKAQVEPPLGQMIEKRQPAGHVGRMMLLQADRRRPQADALRLAQGAGDEDLRHHDVLVLHRVMLADPELAEAQLLGPHDQLQVFVVALGRRLGRIVERHDEHAVVDRPGVVASWLLLSLSSGFGRAGCRRARPKPLTAYVTGPGHALLQRWRCVFSTNAHLTAPTARVDAMAVAHRQRAVFELHRAAEAAALSPRARLGIQQQSIMRQVQREPVVVLGTDDRPHACKGPSRAKE